MNESNGGYPYSRTSLSDAINVRLIFLTWGLWSERQIPDLVLLWPNGMFRCANPSTNIFCKRNHPTNHKRIEFRQLVQSESKKAVSTKLSKALRRRPTSLLPMPASLWINKVAQSWQKYMIINSSWTFRIWKIG